MRYVRLVVFLIAGLAIGSLVGRLILIPVAIVAHVSQGMVNVLGNCGALIGAAIGFLRWRGGPLPGAGSDVHGSARFAAEREVKATLVRPTGLIVGRENNRRGQLLRYDGPAHLITIAPTRSGKGVGAIIPNLLTADRSILCIDPKGENARIAGAARARFGPVHVLDPFGVSGLPSAGFNPLDALDPASLDLAEDAALLADALVYDPPGQVGEAHWNEEAKALLGGLILHVATVEDRQSRTLGRVRELLTLPPAGFGDLMTDMQANRGAGGLVARAANRHLGKGDREAAGVLSSAQRHTHFLDSQRMIQVLDHSSFRFQDLKAGVATLFLVLPPDRLNTHARWLRLLVAQAIGDLARAQAAPGAAPVLFLLDEFAALGRLEPVERAFGLMAGYGLQLWPILQDLHQLRSVYGERSGTFLSNAGLVQVFNVADVETASWVSKSIGPTTIAYQTASSGAGYHPGKVFASKHASTTNHLAKRDLITPDEVMRLDSRLELLLRPGQVPAIGFKVRYYAEEEFQRLL